ncbi:hypothetical protein H7Q97_17480 [Ochrobactrum sp. CM-21-5]|nr:hypothetical protein [Ochrobactrum sp. CM-21-5]MBC2887174.1 hypothetical protein [Ochrobactrum sp. CM-21-5]
MINDLTDEMFWLFTIGCCILFILRLISPPPHKNHQADEVQLQKPRRGSRRRNLRSRWQDRRKFGTD